MERREKEVVKEEGRKWFVVVEEVTINRSINGSRERQREMGRRKGERNQSRLPSSIGFLPPLSVSRAAPLFVPPTDRIISLRAEGN